MRKIIQKKKYVADQALSELIDRIHKGEDETKIHGLYGSAVSFICSLLFKNIKKNLILISPSFEEAKKVYQDFSFFLGHENTCLYPPWDIFSTNDLLSSQRDTMSRRSSILVHLLLGTPCVVIVPLRALMQKVVPVNILGDYVETISIGDTLERDYYIKKLIQGGYKRVSLVEEVGDFSIRGHIIDIFPPILMKPVRLEFMGDEIESIRKFDPISQRSVEEVVDFVLSPAGELIMSEGSKKRVLRTFKARANELGIARSRTENLFETIENDLISSIHPQLLSMFYGDSGSDDRNDYQCSSLDTIFEYVPKDSLVVMDGYRSYDLSEEKLVNDVNRYLHKASNEGKFYLDKECFHVSKDDLLKKCQYLQKIYIEELDCDFHHEKKENGIRFRIETNLGLKQEETFLTKGEGLLAPLARKIKGWIEQDTSINFLCSTEDDIKKMEHLLKEYSLPVSNSQGSFLSDMDKSVFKGQLVLRTGKISEGFLYPVLKMAIVSEEEIFGKKIKRRRKVHAREGYFLKSFGELTESDYVVHVDHGIGNYQGLKRLKIGDIENDFLLVEYLGGDKLYIPVDRLDLIQRYIGTDGYIPKIDKLGSGSWEALKKKVKKSIREIAEELVSIYAAREVMEGHRFLPADRYYEEFSSSFEFEETPDQAKAIEDVYHDMTDSKPMDRLICGDVGFGKTEVAVRASFRAVMDGKQVAILVPTTILAEQHYQTFATRMNRYPLRVEVLNRFKTKQQQKKIIEDANKGLVDIIIGTHRIIQKDLTFKDLGLVIIDEEQRFGVSHKEKFKKIKTLVDVLTMTATPIPRTMQLSLIGMRDLSIIDTPPQDRQSVRVYVSEFDENLIAEAIRRELARNGQVFFVHDRVKSIYNIADFVGRLVPEAQIGVAHGQMKVKELEDVMVKFLHNGFNVLVCTTIIGAGIDIPTANTIIINRADKFGLSQLYQLRGRVGRSKEAAYAYLLIPKDMVLSKDAKKRLQVIQEFSELGSGFRIATHDLEIRGAGNILGASQSGHVSAVGYELYTELMEKTIRELQGDKVPEEEITPEIHFGLSAFIPDNYITDTHIRLMTYKKISIASSNEELSEIRDELMDCYGYVPLQVDNLMNIIGIRNLLKGILARRMDYDGKHMVITLNENSPLDPSLILELSKSGVKDMKLSPDLRLSVSMPGLSDNEVIERAKWLLGVLSKSQIEEI